ncbi:hypothetical protein F4808DRAFT_423286 [Astrocystis sublimbata]|nr:hypothetical protein F4808DRAFT_423286 [Astrocystis sublimbata]
MAPPPATPTPHRFLAPKRSQPRAGISETSTSTSTPTPRPSGGQQFHATPRFSLSSTPRNGPTSSSLTPFRPRASGRNVVIEIESSPPPPPRSQGDDDDGSEYHGGGKVEVGTGRGHEKIKLEYDDLDPVIDDEDEMMRESMAMPTRGVDEQVEIDDGEGVGNGSGGGEWDETKPAKRRRLSSSPSGAGIETSFLPSHQRRVDQDVEMRDTLLDIESSFPEPPIKEEDDGIDSDGGSLPEDEADEEEIDNARGFESSSPLQPCHHHHREKRHLKATQPTFQRAPRFKPTEIPEGAPQPEPLPDVFSPRRKGAKYLQGGLAAELRDWLVDVEAGTTISGSSSGSGTGLTTGGMINAKRGDDWILRIRVDELQGMDMGGSARGMTLIKGRQVINRETSDDGERKDELGTHALSLILAGQGRLSGLGIGNEVRPGVTVGIARPTWEVALDGLGRFGVACDWAVVC